jgi:branched-chain amino acid transport system substrate-binding protein
MGFQPSYRVEARIFAKYILKTKPDAKVAVFYANDDFGKDYVAGLEASEGILSAGYLKDASDPQWKDDEGMKKFMTFIDKYSPGANIFDTNLVYAYAAAQTMVQALRQCGDNLTRENVMKQAASLKDFAPDTLLLGIKISTSASDFAPIEQLKMMQFKGGKWDLFGDIISAETGG